LISNIRTLCLHVQGYEDPWLFFEARGGPRQKSLGNTALLSYFVLTVSLKDWTMSFSVVY